MRVERRASMHDEGNITLLSLGFAVVAILVVLVAAAATAVHLERMRLVHLADELALDAADSLDIAAYYAGSAAEPEGEAAVALAEARMTAQVQHDLADAAARHHLDAVRVLDVSTDDGYTARVVVQVTAPLLFEIDALGPWASGIAITAEATARAW